MINHDRWKAIADIYQTLSEDQKRFFNKEFDKILQDEINKEFIRELKDTK